MLFFLSCSQIVIETFHGLLALIALIPMRCNLALEGKTTGFGFKQLHSSSLSTYFVAVVTGTIGESNNNQIKPPEISGDWMFSAIWRQSGNIRELARSYISDVFEIRVATK